MIKLRVVGSSSDHTELILSNKPKGKRGSHTVVIDKRLLDVLSKAVYGRREIEKAEKTPASTGPPRVEPKLPPREIQRQLRAGASPAQVAKAAEVDVSYVEQFYPPVLYERAGVIKDAQALHQEKPRLGASALPLGEAVATNLAARHVRLSDEALERAWLATRNEGQPWTISLTFPFRGRSRTARWRYDPRVRTLVPVNKLASDIGWVASGKKRVERAASEATERAPKAKARGKPATKVAARRSAARKPAGRTVRTTVRPKPAAGKKAAARKKPAVKKQAARKPARKTRARKPAGRKASAPRRSAVKKRAARKPTRKTAARKPTRKTAARKPARRAGRRR